MLTPMESILLRALRGVVEDVLEYERLNNLAPNPGRSDCWESMTFAKIVIEEIEKVAS